MVDVRTSYLGKALRNPLIVGASRLTSNLRIIERIAELGAGALVIKSLFEEQVELEHIKIEEELHRNDNLYSEMINIFPELNYEGPEEHLMWVKKVKQVVKIPVFASLNAVNKETWVNYAKKLEQTGVDGLELNFYAVPSDFEKTAQEIENEQVDILKNVKKSVSVPISVKISSYYTNPLNVIKKFDETGVEGVVLFNQFFQPDINLIEEKSTTPLNLSDPKDYRMPLRFVGLVYGNIKADTCASTGIMNGQDIARMILAGAQSVQAVSAFYRYGIDYIPEMLKNLKDWMQTKKYDSLDSFRGKMSYKDSSDPWNYKRAQYIKTILHSQPLTKSS